MKKSLNTIGKDHSLKIVAGLSTAIALCSPALAFAGFGSGMLLPTGTTGNLTTALADYLYTTVLATTFQAQMIQIMVVLAALVIMWRLLRFVWRKFHSPAR